MHRCAQGEPLGAALLYLTTAVTLAAGSAVLGPTGEVLIAPSANNLSQIEAPQLAPAPGASMQQLQADCLMEQGTFYGSDFLSTRQIITSSARDCCAACKTAADCTVWNWCGAQGGCPMPPNLAAAGNRTSVDFQTCLWKPRPLAYAGTLPEAPTANNSAALSGWTSGIPINGSLLPALNGYQLTPGIELGYSEETDFYCTGSSTSKPVCQLYGNAKGGALACLNNPICRGFQICWAFPAGADQYSQTGVIRMKAGQQAPLNISTAFQNPYCSVYVLRAGAASAPSSGGGGYSLAAANNISAISTAISNLGSRRLLQAPAAYNSTGQLGPVADAAPRAAPSSSQGFIDLSPPTPAGGRAVSAASAASVPPSQRGTNYTSAFLAGATLQTFQNATFNYTQCYSNAPTIRATIQAQQFPLQGPTSVQSLHTWLEVPFRNSGDACCAFADTSDYFLNLATGALARTLPMYVATNETLVTGPSLKSYETVPPSIVSPLVFIPAGQLSNPAVGQGRQFTFPRSNSSDYVTGLEQMYFLLAQVALGNRFCTPGSPQLGPAVAFVAELLRELSDGSEETLGGVPADLEFVATHSSNPDGSSSNASCLIERGAVYEGDVLRTITAGNGTVEACCEACWLFYDPLTSSSCDVWTLDAGSGACQLKNSTLAEDFQAVPAQRGTAAAAFTSGRRTAVIPSTLSNVFEGEVF